MYKHAFFLALVVIGLHACGPVYVVQQTPPPPAPAPPPPANPEDVSYQTFYDQLSPYGQWIQDPEYGYVWMPDVSQDFKPYATNGHWVYTDEGWAWDSGYPWGWAAFHYGRWFFRDGYGWMWVPGSDWAPAWVSWRNSDDYYGWAPMQPGISVSVAYSSGYNPPPHYWCFVPHQYVASPQINNYYVHENNNVTIINRTTVINNVTIINHYGNNRYGAGPDANEVGRFTGTPLRPVTVRESRTPGGPAAGGATAGQGFAVYRPRVNAAPPAGDPHANNNNGRPGYAPSSFHPLSDARPINRTSYGTPPATSTPPAAGNNPPAYNRPPIGQPANAQPANTQPANAQPTYNRPPANQQFQPNRGGQPNYGGQPTNGQPTNGQPNTGQPTNGQPSRGFQPTGRPSGQPSAQPAQPAAQPGGQPGGQPAAQPAGRPAIQQPAPAIRQQPQGRGFTPQNTQNTNQTRPVGNTPKPASQQRKTPPPQKKDEGKDPNKP